MGKTASALVSQALSWLGRNESDGTHRLIIDTYNAHVPLARGYKVTYNDAWCATFVSACSIRTGMTDIIPTECGAHEMMNLFKGLDEWDGNRDRRPNTGDIIFYDWKSDGRVDHVGVVEYCDGSTVQVIEGNYQDSVRRRQIRVGDARIAGYGIPKYTKTTGIDNVKTIWTFLFAWLGNPFGVAGLMGNLYAESALNPKNLQQTFEKKLGMSDESYTEGVDGGSYTNFVYDKAGYGLAQWTYWSRKKALLEFAKDLCASVGNLDIQLNFMMKEMIESYPGLVTTLKGAQTVQEASDAVLTIYEQPADQGDAVKATRASYGQKYFDQYAQVTNTSEKRATQGADNHDEKYRGEWTAVTDVYIRNGAGKTNPSLGVLPKDAKVQCYGYYSIVNGTIWLYVQGKVDGVKYTGHVSAKYLRK